MKKNFNGFATEEQYEAIKDIIIPAIDEYTDTIMIICHTLSNGRKNVEVDVDTKSGHSLRYHMDEDGVFYVNTEGENFPIQECKILVRLDETAEKIFNIIDTYDRQENLKKFLGGDESVISTNDEYRKDLAITAKANLDNAINTNTTKISKGIVRDVASGVFLWREEDIIPILEEHYGLSLTNSGNKFYYFEYK